MNAKPFKQFSPRDKEELRNTLFEIQKLDPPKRTGENPDDVRFDCHEFYLGQSKQFRITRIK